VLYNLHRAKEAIRKEDRVILVEGYMDAIGVSAAGFGPVVASCGTSLTEQQVKALKRHSGRIVVNFDPDAAGANATGRSMDMLLQYDFDVRILELTGGLDPDEFCLKRGAAEYRALLSDAKKYFFWLAQRGIATTENGGLESRVALMKTLVSKLQLMSDPWEQVAIAHELAGYLGIGDDLAREFRKAIIERRRPEPKPVLRRGGYSERVLLTALLDESARHDEVIQALEGCAAVGRLPTSAIFQAIFAIHRAGSQITFESLNARLEEGDRQRLAEIVLTEDGEVETSREHVMDCVRQLVQSEERESLAQLKARVKEAERAGNLAEALRLAREVQDYERGAEERK
jgi:DNA primase